MAMSKMMETAKRIMRPDYFMYAHCPDNCSECNEARRLLEIFAAVYLADHHTSGSTQGSIAREDT